MSQNRFLICYISKRVSKENSDMQEYSLEEKLFEAILKVAAEEALRQEME
jgi:hypothetical protein